jgi:hypothetical protein
MASVCQFVFLSHRASFWRLSSLLIGSSQSEFPDLQPVLSRRYDFPRATMPVSFASTGGSLPQTVISLVLAHSHRVRLVVGKPVSTLFRHFSAASRGISRVSVEPFAAVPCSQIPVGPQRLALSVSRCCPFLSIEEWTPTMWVISGFNRTALRLAVYASCQRRR